jgi:hypothetical protein
LKKPYLAGLLALVMALGVNWAVPAGAHDGHDTHDGSGPAGAGPAKHENMELTFISDDPFSSPGNTNPDLAFWGNLAYVPNYKGLRIFDISTTPPSLLSTTPCEGPQNDVTVWDRDDDGAADILFMSVDSVMENKSCGAAVKAAPNQGNGPYDTDDWEGIRIFDVSNPASPVPLDTLAVYQDCGSHTHTLVPDTENNRVLLYNASYSLRNGPSCGPGFAEATVPARSPLHGVIQVVEVEWSAGAPLNNSLLTATEIAEPPVNYPGDNGNVFDPQAHGLPATSGGAPLNDLRACHDIGVFMELLLAAAACAEQLQLWEIDPGTLLPDTSNPRWTFDNIADTDGPGGGDSVTDFWHSATFSWDGKVINAIDESFGTGCPTVSPNTDPNTPAQFRGPSDSGRMYFIDTATGKELSQFVVPRPESAVVDPPGSPPPAETAYCSAHLGLQVPAAGRDLLVSSWYTGGVSVIDFTAVKNPKEVAYFDFERTAGEAEQTGSNNWTAYWYDPTPGHNQAPWTAYGQDISKGFEQFEVELRTSHRYGLPFLNPQTQMEILP